MRNRLTAKQSAFVNAIVAGKNATEAYRAAYSCKRMSDNAVYVEAFRMLENPKISLSIEAGRDAARNKAVWTRELALERLAAVNGYSYSELMENGFRNGSALDAFLKTAGQLNKMCGFEETKETEKSIVPVFVYERH